MTNGNHVVGIDAGLAAGTLITKTGVSMKRVLVTRRRGSKRTYQTDIEEGTFAMVGFSTTGIR